MRLEGGKEGADSGTAPRTAPPQSGGRAAATLRGAGLLLWGPGSRLPPSQASRRCVCEARDREGGPKGRRAAERGAAERGAAE